MYSLTEKMVLPKMSSKELLIKIPALPAIEKSIAGVPDLYINFKLKVQAGLDALR
jgi:hypothetical protein